MPAKSRKSEVREELLRQLEDLDRRAQELDRQIVVTLEKARRAREKLRAVIARE
ncbi:MAG: hypothetical protein WEB06_13760 [Actinomycetota bacterium]